MATLILQCSAALLLCGAALALPSKDSNVRRAVTPIVSSTTGYGSLDNQGLNRDSCTSTLWSNNALWVCRDTQPVTNGVPGFPIVANTASFSSTPSATNLQTLVLTSPQGFGTPFYPLEADECPPFGLCSDGTRWVGWPDTAPVVTFRGTNGEVNAYAFIGRDHLSGLATVNMPCYSLYHVISQSVGPIPSTSMDASSFWSTTQIAYGSAASVVNNGFVNLLLLRDPLPLLINIRKAYLYGATPNGKLALARAALTGFLGSLEDRSVYQYYVNGAWTSTAPPAYVWIGGDGFPDANFFISTAPNPEGPWTVSQKFYSGSVGTGSLPAYSAVAHPSLTDGTGNYIFLLWVCRDTQSISNGQTGGVSVANTASYSSLPNARTNPQPLVLSSPQGLGPLFYKLEADECPDNGICSDGTRWVGWPDTGPVVTFSGSGGVNAYAFIARQHLSGLSVLNTPNYSLYHVLAQGVGNTSLPSTSVDISGFWSSTQIGYGSAASVVINGFAYLYGATPNGKLAVARAALTGFLGSLEDRSIYEYYVNGAWTPTVPVRSESTIPLPNTSSVQGTIYWSPKWQAYVWIGGDGFPDANFLISTAPNPEGPWSAPKQFYSGAVGTGSLPAYSAVAHPSLTDGTGNYIFITWTKTAPDSQGNDVYDQPLVRVDWQ
ncbi:hypothetical protein B0H17DRAFT_1333749 [Mycena rosella]|uniref:DUF4185 domain-containing protein n=1 Tax=Mycena rosella TaxID=1033263 RepID=A0AAD7GC75_MYCRO|nr:hypothetical protein B0H17DRAFT_1333749 [Mycena rosella]